MLFFTGCAPKKIIVQYNVVSVPEEGGIQFTQYTDDGVVGPVVTKSETGFINWYAAPLIDVSYDGKQVAYIDEKSGNYNIFIRNILGGRSTIQRTFRNRVMDMAFSPNGEKIAFTDADVGNENIYVINAKQGAAIQQVTTSSSSELGPCYSNDNEYIFFTKNENSRYYVWSFNTKSSLMTQYGEGYTPCLTPDGENLIVTRTNKTTFRGEIWMINIKTGQETLLLNDANKGYSSPRVSPDGKRIVCVGTTNKTATRPENLDIYTFKIDGTDLQQHTFHGGHDVSPVWGADGQSIFFLGQRGNEKGLWNVWRMQFKSTL